MKTHPATGKELIPPLWYALGAIAATPLVALCMVMAGILMILVWPFIPILCYFQRKEEICKANVCALAQPGAQDSPNTTNDL